MKPERLELAGFAAFRSPTTVDFSGLEIFALTGPTGAGKSSVIDAITFALYGVVPRYGKGSVEPVISLGMAEAKVRLDFTVEGAPHTAVRVVRRTTTGGATTAEARLESVDAVVSGAKEVTAAVEDLLGLNADHFMRSVVLPQGEFAAFLHDRPSGQQDLVKALLDLGVLDEVRALAVGRMRTATALAEAGRARLDDLADATEAAQVAAAAVVERLVGLGPSVAAIENEMTERRAQAADHQRLLEAARLGRDLLMSVAVPDDVDRLASALVQAAERAADARLAGEVAATDLEKARSALDELPTIGDIAAQKAVHARLREARARLSAIDMAGLAEGLKLAVSRRQTAEEALAGAAADVGRIQTAYVAHSLSVGLTVGDECPVCHRSLESAPHHDPPPGLDLATAAEASARTGLAAAVKAAEAVEKATFEAAIRVENAADEERSLAKQATRIPPEDELARLGAARTAAEEVAAEAKKAMKAAAQAATATAEASQALVGAEQAARREFDATRDRLATLEPPPATRQELAADWRTLASWAVSRVEQASADVERAEAVASATLDHLDELHERADRLLGEAGVGGEGSHSSRLASALATARALVERIEERRQTRAGLEGDVEGCEERLAVAKQLAGHLRSNRFEAWMLAEALESLLLGSNRLLSHLSGDAYSLVAGRQSIEIIDHRNADERRSVKSLSGGETFLVSLALALSLGEQLATLSSRGGARLEAIFLDEGFGTLDVETLDTVGAVVAELAAQGRMVGLVTHVQDLAEQVPVRFEVRSQPTGSTIQQVVR